MLCIKRFRSGPRWAQRESITKAARRHRGRYANSRSVFIGTVLWLALGVAGTISWARLILPQAGRIQSGSATSGRTPQKGEDSPPPPLGMSYTTNLDRTAIWVGDEFHYVIAVDYSSEFEFVLDNLNKEDVNMDPFTVLDITKKIIPLTNPQTRLLLDMKLANYSLNLTEAHIPQLSLYYFRHDQHTTPEQAAAESLIIPGLTIGLRSTLPSNPADIRDSAVVVSWQRSRWVVPTVGLAALAFLIASVAWEAYLFFKKRSTTQGPDRRISMDAVRTRWTSGVPSDFSDSQKMREFLDWSYRNMKEYLAYYLRIETAGLTAEEVRGEMERSGASSDLAQKAGNVLSTCETVRYSEHGIIPNAEAVRSLVQDVREILSQPPKN